MTSYYCSSIVYYSTHDHTILYYSMLYIVAEDLAELLPVDPPVAAAVLGSKQRDPLALTKTP